MRDNYDLVKYKFETGIYTLESLCDFVDKHLISEEDFHYITSYNYQAIKNKRNI